MPYIYIFRSIPCLFSSTSHSFSLFLLSIFFMSPFISILGLWISSHPHVLMQPPPFSLSPRLNAGHEQNSTHHGEGRHAFLQRFLHHTHVLSVPLLHPDREVCAQPPHLHQQWKLLLTLVAGPPRAAHLRCTSQQLWLQDRWMQSLTYQSQCIFKQMLS